MRRANSEVILLDGKQATGWGNTLQIADAGHKIIELSVVGQGEGDVITVKVATSCQDSVPAFSTAASATNRWGYERIRDKDTGTLYAGSTGFSFSNSNTTSRFIIEDDASKWLSIHVSTYTDANTSGSITGYLSTTNDTE